MKPPLSIPQHFPIEFGTNWEFLLQQKPSVLKGCVTPATINGEKKSFNQLGEVEMQRITQRIGPTRHTELPSDKRWITAVPYDVAIPYDEFDQSYLGNIVLPTSEAIESHRMAYNRKCDDIIIDAALGIAYSGEDGVTPNPFDPNQIIPADYVVSGASVNSGLTVPKLIAIKSLFGTNLVDDEDEIFFVHTQKQLDDLLLTTQATSSDYAAVKALVEGKINRFLGMTFKKSQRIPKDANDLRTCFAFAKRGIKFADEGRQVHMDILPMRNHALQIRTKAKMGGVRMEEKLVAQVICDESPAA